MTDANFRGETNSNSFDYNNVYINMSKEDKTVIDLLMELVKANNIAFIADVLSMQATVNAIALIYKKYTKSKEKIYNPDELLIYAISAGLFARIIITGVGYQKYNIALEKYTSGDKTVDMNIFSSINYTNVLFIYGGLIALNIAYKVYESNRINIFE